MKFSSLSFLLIVFLIFSLIPQASAVTFGIGEEAWVEPERELRGTIRGVLGFDKIPDSFTCNVSPQIKHGLVNKDDSIDIDENMDYLFVRIGNKDSQQVWQLQIGYPAQDLSYDIHLKSGKNQLGGALYSPDSHSQYSNFGMIIEPYNKATVAANSFEHHLYLPEYDKFLDSVGKHTYLPFGLPMEKNEYTLNTVVFDSENDWINSDRCGIKAVIPISVDENGIAKVGIIKLSDVLVSDVTEDLPPLKQYKLGVDARGVDCKPGYRLVLNENESGDKRPACVTPETKEKLIERGWAFN